MKSTWEEVKRLLKSQLPGNAFTLWIHPLTYLDRENNTILLGCPNKFSRNWVTENYLGLIQQKFHEIGGSASEIHLKLLSSPSSEKTAPEEDSPQQLCLPAFKPSETLRRLSLNGDFTFDSFVVGPSNEFAYSASKAMAQNPKWDYHSLLMLANTGLGKTHLTKALGYYLLQANPNLRINYITAEDFTNEMVVSLKNNQIEKFKQKYRRACDVLLLEEIHFLQGKEKTQQELGYTLDALANDKKKIIFTSSLPPKDIPRMSKELSSRLVSGLVTTISKPDLETRARILAKKAAEHRLKLSEEILGLLANALTRDVRQMESALKCLKAKSELLKIEIDRDLTKDVLSSLVSAKHAITCNDIQNVVCQYYKIEPEMLQSKSRKKAYACPRNIYAYLCRKHTDETLETIANNINRSHSTVVYASELVAKKLKSDETTRKQVAFFNEKLESLAR